MTSLPTQTGYHWVWVADDWIVWKVEFNLSTAQLEVYNTITSTWEPADTYPYYIHISPPAHPESNEPF